MNIKANVSSLMMYIFFFLVTIVCIWGFSSVCLANGVMDYYEPSDILTSEIDHAISSDITDSEEISDPLRQGAYSIVHGKKTDKKVKGVLFNEQEIDTYIKAQDNTSDIVKKGVNYALSFVSFFALVYLLYHGFLMVTASGDETKYQKGWKGLKTVLIALLGIGLSWFVVNLIFWLLDKGTSV